MTCSKQSMLWPMPTGQVDLSEDLINFLPGDLAITVSKGTDFAVQGLVLEMRDIFEEYLYMMHPRYIKASGKNPFPSLRSANAEVKVVLSITSNETRVTMETDESYDLKIEDGGHKVAISAETYFGARHGLETLSQLISYDDLREALQMHAQASVEDKPEYVHRGLLIDTSR
jgi:hexosaminidase